MVLIVGFKHENYQAKSCQSIQSQANAMKDRFKVKRGVNTNAV